jgi:cobalamin synthase
VKTAAIAELLGGDRALAALVAAGALSRAASPVLASLLPYPRIGGGPGSVLTGHVRPPVAVLGATAAAAIAIAALGADGAIVALSVAGSTAALGVVYMRRFGGATGDALGTATEVGETLALVVAAALM